jgi:lipoprotein-anchoring transpeptidase ErfK/SrfK
MGRVSVVAAVAAALLLSAASAHAGLVVRPVADDLVLHGQPSGSVVARLGPRTEFGSPLVLAVAARRGRWLGVITPNLPNGRLAWVDARTVRTRQVKTRIDVSLSARTLTLVDGRTILSRIPVGIGAPSFPTPTGTYAVTDKLSGAGTVYGCCILALSGHQPRPPRSWNGSDTRLAVHGGAFGAVSSGCLHASAAALRFLLAHVPLGTRVTIRR